MSTYGFPDGQQITQWLGQPLVEAAGAAVGAGSIVKGPFALANFASVIIAIKPTGGPVTVRITQAIAAGPPGLSIVETIPVAAGATLFEAVVLFADQVTLEIDGSVAGTTVDYALVPSNTTTNAQVITAATIDVEHNGLLVAAESALDFEDGNGQTWTVVDDAPNTRVKITPPRQVARQNGILVVGNTTALTQIAQLSIPGGAMGADGFVLAEVMCAYVNASGATAGLELLVGFGSASAWEDVWTIPMESTAQVRDLLITIKVANLGVTNSQKVQGTIQVGDFNGAPLIGQGKLNGPINDANTFGRTAIFGSSGTIGEDTTVLRNLVVSIAHGVANPNVVLSRFAAIAQVP